MELALSGNLFNIHLAQRKVTHLNPMLGSVQRHGRPVSALLAQGLGQPHVTAL